jgi:hypothetical protein
MRRHPRRDPGSGPGCHGRLILDTLGCAVGGTGVPSSGIVARVRAAGPPQATLLVDGARVSLLSAVHGPSAGSEKCAEDLGWLWTVWGTDRVPEAAAWTPHVSVAYAFADGPGDQFAAALGGLGDVAEAMLRAVDLIKLGRDQHVYEWEPVELFPLGGL